MGNKHYKPQKKRKDKPLRPMGAIPQLEVVKVEQVSRGETLKVVGHGGYTPPPWTMKYYETTIVKG